MGQVSDGGLTSEEVAELRKLLDIERIRKVMQLYSHLFDSRDWNGFMDLYLDDAVCEWGHLGTWHGREQILPRLVEGHRDRLPYDGFHMTTNLWVDVTGPDTARSRSYLLDVWETASDDPIVGYATYEHDYKKINGEWKISHTVIEWIWPKRVVTDDYPRALDRKSIG